MNLKIKPLKLAKAVLAIGFLMNKKILYLILFFLISSCSNSYQIEKDKADVVPAWFLVKDDKNITATAVASSGSLQLAKTKALNLALSELNIKISGSINSNELLKIQEQKTNKTNNIDEKFSTEIKISSEIEKIPKYKILNEEFFLTKDNLYKVYIKLIYQD
jgi:hypothetical protein